MTNEKRANWVCQIAAAIGVLMWIGATMYFKLYPITILIVVTAVPATVYNFVCEARSTKSACW